MLLIQLEQHEDNLIDRKEDGQKQVLLINLPGITVEFLFECLSDKVQRIYGCR